MQFSEYANQTWEPVNLNGKADPFNYPSAGRKDTMNLSSIMPDRDGMKTTTFKFQTGRATSTNMAT